MVTAFTFCDKDNVKRLSISIADNDANHKDFSYQIKYAIEC